MLRTLAFLVTVLLPLVALADPPKAIITGPTDGVAGDLIELDFSESVADKKRVYIEPERFSDGRPAFKLAKDGNSVWLASRPGTVFRVELIVSNMDGPDRAVMVVTIAGGTPTPPKPDPVNPTPTPPKPLPAGRFDMANWVRTQVWSNVPADKRGACASFGGNYGTVAAQIAAGTVKTLADANAKLKEMNRKTAGTDYEFWGANVMKALIARQGELAKTGLVNSASLDDAKDLFAEIASGFLAAGN